MSEARESSASTAQQGQSFLRGSIRLLADPARAAEELPHGLVASAVVIVAAVIMFAFSFQFLLPRLKDTFPVLGSLRQGVALIAGGHDVMDWEVFWPELLATLICVAIWFVLHMAAGFLSRQKDLRDPLGALFATGAAALPLLYASLIAIPLYHVRERAGGILFLGFLLGAFVCYHALVNRYKAPRWLAVYVAPIAFLVQTYVVYRFMQ